MAYCEKCGAQIGETTDFCTGCGNKISSKPKKGGCGKMALIIIVAVIAVIGIFILSMIGITNQMNTDWSTIDQANQQMSGNNEPNDVVIKGTVSQQNAVKSARNYLTIMSFPRKGLIKQLEFEGYSTEDATYGVDYNNTDWNEQAVKSAKNYLDTMSFSRKSLIQQLEFEGFTHEQAVHGVDATGL